MQSLNQTFHHHQYQNKTIQFVELLQEPIRLIYQVWVPEVSLKELYPIFPLLKLDYKTTENWLKELL